MNILDDILKNELLAEAAGKVAVAKTVTLAGVWGSSAPLVAAAIGRLRGVPVLYVTPHLDDADEVADDYEVFTGKAAQLFPAWETDIRTPDNTERITDEVAGERVRVCNLLLKAKTIAQAGAGGDAIYEPHTDEPIDFVVAPVMALLQPVPTVEALAVGRLTLSKGQDLAIEDLSKWLVDAGFDHVEQVDQQGEFAHRGGIVDIFPSGTSQAVRVEFFGETIDSIRRFDLDTQRSTDEVDSYDVTAVAAGRETDPRRTTTFLSYLPPGTVIVIPEPAETMEIAREIYRRLAGQGRHSETQKESGRAAQANGSSARPHAAGLHDPDELFLKLAHFPLLEMQTFAGADNPATVHLNIRSLERLALNTHEALLELTQLAQVNDTCVYCENPAEEKRFLDLVRTQHADLAKRMRTAIGHVHSGFHWPLQHMVIVGHHEIFHRYNKVRRIRRVRSGRPIDSLLDLNEGDYVVHVAHGIAHFEGLHTLQRDGRSEEYLRLRFAENAVLNVPTSSINLVQKYIGSHGRRPALSHLGGTGWQKQKARATAAVHDMAADLLKIQAQRMGQSGTSYPLSTEWQQQFVDEFIYTETEDQIVSMRQIDDDMAAPRPMDRLLCGDVGYGKTELAMRAAFRVAEAGKQVAVLVPTTVLASQHFRTFSERFADYPLRIDHISRFRRKKEQDELVTKLAMGQIDILIGTHRLLSKDVKFPDLGLVVIDEEQRFGVKHKEKLKGLRATVDMLTMTATPIPRTLHMALLGLRDISNLTTPPLDRRAIHTEVRQYDDELIRAAIDRELNRQGQVFFVHNRVMDIESVAAHIRGLVPDARVEIGHGQMPEGQLEKIMLRFISQQIDVLVCTTIIESGLDIPSANTMIIHEADRYGLAELHQLRGRVGRYKHRAYCYLMLPETRPVSSVAAKRLKAIEEFSDLGAGFQIAMRDLEIRGAGNILGPEQSGHIAAVGYELYCQLLEKSVRQLKGEVLPMHHEVHVELGVDSYIPRDFVPSERQRMEIYRRMVRCGSFEELTQLTADIKDAYGPMPAAVATMLDLAEVRVRSGQLGIRSIIRMDPDLIFTFYDFKLAGKLFDGARGTVRLPDDHTVHWRLPPAYLEMPTLVRVLLNRLRQAQGQV